MNEDPTQDISQKYDTKPTMETVMDAINALRDEMRAGFDRVDAKFDEMDRRLSGRIDSLDGSLKVRLDRIESEVKQTHSEFYALRADFQELKSALKEHLPIS